MWNRVVLLVAGVALGWNVVNYLVAPAERARRHRTVAIVAALAGLGMAAWLVPTSGAGGLLLALFVLLATALVAYAGHAREASKVDEPLPRALPPRPEVADPRVALLLVADGDPRTYDGPGPWARRLRRCEAAGRPTPHWFARPWALARIRAAYARLAPTETAEGWLGGVAAALGQALGPGYAAEAVMLSGAPSLASTLSRLAEAGHRRVLLAPVAGEDALPDLLRGEITRSRVRELGVQVTVLPSGPDAALSARLDGRLQALLSGQDPAPLTDLAAPLVAGLAAAVRAALPADTG